MSSKYTLILGSAVLAAAVSLTPVFASDDFSPYGTATVDMKEYPVTNAVFDANYQDPNDLNLLYAFVNNTRVPLKGHMIVVTHGPELRAFAKENYVKYQAIVDRMAELAEEGVEFRMCRNALLAAGYAPDDFHGFITVVPAGFPELAYLQAQGYKYINPLPYSPLDVRYLDQPHLRK
ncbi:hypothetical protein B1C78_14660 [Thioalkalivibrio denitrificans]|uniref:Uncharacterized protein n=2 Tax=Thioalkalivibrio denitrificans TaxID=108003 RepID=A0A1V3NC60_9GAMM|nr:hypothetical protein B1C78_14660 [Thioalkalivibrio denitrificans]